MKPQPAWPRRNPRAMGAVLGRGAAMTAILVGLGLALVAMRMAFETGARAEAAVAQTAPALATEHLRAGDVVFRRGRSFGSQAVVSVDPTSPYSHVGILASGSEETDWRVIHVMPQGVAEITPVQLDPLAHFISADEASSYAIYRLRGADTAQTAEQAANIAHGFYDRGVVFDSRFDLSTDDAMYCTELVWKAYLGAGIDLMDGRLDVLEGPFFSGQAVLPSSLQKSAKLVQVN
jgi:hypothetical protein